MPTIPYVAQTWTDGSGGGTPVSAARLGVMESGITNVSYAPAVRAFHNANQSITNNTVTVLALNSERYDQAGNASDTQHDNVTNNSRLTAKYAGVYDIKGLVEWAANATGERYAAIRLNGATNIAATRILTNTQASAPTDMTVSCNYSLGVNDYVELVVLQQSGGALNVSVTGNISPEFMMSRIG